MTTINCSVQVQYDHNFEYLVKKIVYDSVKQQEWTNKLTIDWIEDLIHDHNYLFFLSQNRFDHNCLLFLESCSFDHNYTFIQEKSISFQDRNPSRKNGWTSTKFVNQMKRKWKIEFSKFTNFKSRAKLFLKIPTHERLWLYKYGGTHDLLWPHHNYASFSRMILLQ